MAEAIDYDRPPLTHEFTPGNEWLETFSGMKCNPLWPDPSYTLDDLVWGTARACRYNGQLRDDIEVYSVAEHQCLLHDWALEHKPELTPKQRRTLIMHDATEGIIGDMIRPLKRIFTDFSRAEDYFYGHLARRYDLVDPIPAWVKELDTRIIRDERLQALNPSDNVWATDQLEPLGVRLRFWLPRRAAREYRERLAVLGVV